MTNRIAAMTIIKGSGDCLAVYNDKVDENVVKMQQRHEQEMEALREQLHTVTESRNRMLARRTETLRELEAQAKRERGFFVQIGRKIEAAWACLFCLGMRLGLWAVVED